MSKQNSKTIEATIEVLEREANKFIGGLERELEEAKGQRLTEQTQNDLQAKIDQARASYNAILEPKRKELESARATETLALQQLAAEIVANAAQVKENMKAQMMAAWIRSGGDEDVFDEVFPQLYAAEMTKRALGEPEQPTGAAQTRIISGSF